MRVFFRFVLLLSKSDSIQSRKAPAPVARLESVLFLLEYYSKPRFSLNFLLHCMMCTYDAQYTYVPCSGIPCSITVQLLQTGDFPFRFLLCRSFLQHFFLLLHSTYTPHRRTADFLFYFAKVLFSSHVHRTSGGHILLLWLHIVVRLLRSVVALLS